MRPFFLLIHPKGKKKTQKPTKRAKTRQEDKPRTTKAKPQKIGGEDEKQRTKRQNERQNERQTRLKP